ncbi:hypothetical protein [Curtobacterium sp. MEB011]|uniref:hypothetical protein n=1 Tax=Curtobacterium sp. MEB011 TaxID=3040285 RepID=UPI002550FF6B|nr:hypothetical protein [Curtobacterium sp. MEB011]
MTDATLTDELDVATPAEKSVDGTELRDTDLLNVYAHTHGPVAFVDESYRLPGQAHGPGYYYVAAVIVDRGVITTVRTALTTIAGGLTWHTTDEARDTAGQARIITFNDYVAANAVSVVAVETVVGNDDLNGDKAREACLLALLRCLSAEHLSPSGLVVYDRRQTAAQQADDVRMFKRIRQDADVATKLETYAGRQGSEPMLWSADAVAWTTRRALAMNDGAYIQPFLRRKTLEIITSAK